MAHLRPLTLSSRGGADLEVDLRAELVEVARQQAALPNPSPRLQLRERELRAHLDALTTGDHVKAAETVTLLTPKGKPGRASSASFGSGPGVADGVASVPRIGSARSLEGLHRALSGRNLLGSSREHSSFRQSQRQLFGDRPTAEVVPERRFALTHYEKHLCSAMAAEALARAVCRCRSDTNRPVSSAVKDLDLFKLVRAEESKGSDRTRESGSGRVQPAGAKRGAPLAAVVAPPDTPDSGSGSGRLIGGSAKVSPLPARGARSGAGAGSGAVGQSAVGRSARQQTLQADAKASGDGSGCCVVM